MDNILSAIPNMNTLLNHSLFDGVGRERVKRAVHEVLDCLRTDVISGARTTAPTVDECAELVLKRIGDADITNLRRVINATGVILHTNLGRAPLGDELYSASELSGYCNLEYDLETGQRGSRYAHVESLICELTGAQAAMVVNNNAAAMVLMLGTLAKDKKVAISRGELVEIGGSFRVPEIMEQSGAELIEVGATNKTRLIDYANAVSKHGAEVLLKVHTSNFEIVGFTESVSVSALAELGALNNTPVLYDVGACFLIEPELLGIDVGETARSGITAGADVICFSGDKLMGSAQAGILAGKSEYIAVMKKHPFARAFRPDKLTLSVLEATLRICRYPDEAKRRIPVLTMLSADADELRRRASVLAEQLKQILPDWEVGVREVYDETGGGSLPNVQLPGWAVALVPSGISVTELECRLRRSPAPVIVRIYNGAALISMRTLLPGEDNRLVDIFRRMFEPGG